MHLFVILISVALVAGALITLRIMSPAGNRLAFDTSALPYLIEDIVVVPADKRVPFFVVDVDLDGNDDLLVNKPDRLLWYRLRGSDLLLAGEGGYEREGSTRMVTDANGDGHPDFFVLTNPPEGPMLSCHDFFSPGGPSTPLFTIGPLYSPTEVAERPWNRIRFLDAFAGGKDAHPRIFIGLNPRQSTDRPRSLLAYDGITGRKQWSFDFGPYLWDFAWDGSGASGPRILFATHSVGSGKTYGGTVDSISYVFCLDPEGSPQWSRPVAGYGGRSSLVLADINDDRQNEVLIARCPRKDNRVARVDTISWAVAAFDREGAMLASISLQFRPIAIKAGNLDDDRLPEILVLGIDGDLAILDNDLTLRDVISVPLSFAPSHSVILGPGDIAGDGRPEIVCQMDGMLFVRDRKGAWIAARDFKRRFEMQLARFDGRNHIVAAVGDSIRVMVVKQVPFVARLRAQSLRVAIGAVMAAVVVGAGGFYLRRYLKRRQEGRIILDEAHDEILKAMSAFGHGGSSLKVIDRLKLHLKNWDRIQADGETREDLFAKLRETYTVTVVPEINHIVMLARKARVPDGVWSSLRAEAGFASGEIDSVLDTGADGDAYRREHIARALGALDAVDGSLAGIRAHLRSIFRTPVAEALERLVARFRDEHGARGISFAFAGDAAEAGEAFIYPVTFDKIFESLLTNAVRATDARTGAEIAIAVQVEGIYCRIDVRDNGCGIPSEDWERVFDRHYTTKPEGGGFGLHYAREELAKFGGKIYVLASDAGSGTTMRVVLRRTEKTGGV